MSAPTPPLLTVAATLLRLASVAHPATAALSAPTPAPAGDTREALAAELWAMAQGQEPMADAIARMADRLAALTEQPAAPDLMMVVERILNAGHLYTEDRWRLQAAWERAASAAPAQEPQQPLPEAVRLAMSVARIGYLSMRATGQACSHKFIDNAIEALDAAFAASSPAPAVQPEPAASLPSVPAGFKLVPVTPTQEMHDAGRAALSGGSVPMEKVYRAMIAASPDAPAVQPTEAVAELVEALAEIAWSNDSKWQMDRALAALAKHGQPQGGKEAAQRERMAEKFANRATTQATADFDLPAQSDVVQPQGGGNV